MDSSPSWEEEITINHGSLRPLYVQVKEALEEWITNGLHEGSLCPGDRLPSENELSEKLKISPITVKRALDDLRRQGLIHRIQGRGSFIAEQHKIVLPLTKLFSLTDLTLQQGMTPARHTLSIVEQAASLRLANRLNIAKGESVIKLVRIRLMDSKPFIVETTYLPSPLFPDFLALFTDQIPLYDLLAKHYHHQVVRAEDIIEPVLIRPNEARIFEIPIGSLAFLIQRVAFDAQNRPLESTKSVFRGDLVNFSIETIKEEYER
jgi:GntR family transcriptional regulator